MLVSGCSLSIQPTFKYKPSICSDPVKIDTGIVIQCASWSPKGSILAIGGAQQSAIQVRWYYVDVCHSHTDAIATCPVCMDGSSKGHRV